MASVAHVVVGMAAGRWFARGERPWRAMVAFGAVSILPDLDVIAFAFRIPYGAPFGHRGASHSLAVALLVGAVAYALSGTRRARAGVLAAIVCASHGILDAMTDGGRGVALLWPFSDARIFFPFRPIPVAPIGAHFVSATGLRVAAWELAVFLPLLVYALWPRHAAKPAETRSRIR